MTSLSNNTLDYYEMNASAYADSTMGIDMAELREHLTKHLKPNARILDAGCGSGRDSLAFKEAGYSITAFDGSVALARIASTLLSQPVPAIRFEELDIRGSFNAVWANASLLHLEDAALEITLKKLLNCLTKDGLLFASFKLGSQCNVDDLGRFFNNMSALRFHDLISRAGGTLVSATVFEDKRGRAQPWLITLSKQKPE